MDTEIEAGGVTNADSLRGYVHRVANMHDERDEVNESIREIYRDAKEAGFDTTVLREIVKEYRTDAEARQSRYALLDAYRSALGMLADTPLGEAAMRRTADDIPIRRPKPFAEQPLHKPRGRPRKERGVERMTDPIAEAMAEELRRNEPAGAA
jgi:uncharacterized protein (UPF0335 family)